MSNVPADLRFAESHEWARLEADGSVTVGISDHAQEALGDVVFVELAEVGKVFEQGDAAGVVESVKAASDIYAPIGGEVIAVNEDLGDSPEETDKVLADLALMVGGLALARALGNDELSDRVLRAAKSAVI